MAEQDERELSDKEQVFVAEYLKCWNSTEAARRAGYKHPNKLGPRKLVEVGIQRVIEARKAELLMSAEEVLQRLTEQGRGEQSAFLEPDGRNGAFINLTALIEAGKGHLIKKIKRDGKTNRITEVEFYDTQAALELMGKHHKLFTEKVEHTGPNDGPIKVEDVTAYRGMDRAELNRGIEQAIKPPGGG